MVQECDSRGYLDVDTELQVFKQSNSLNLEHVTLVSMNPELSRGQRLPGGSGRTWETTRPVSIEGGPNSFDLHGKVHVGYRVTGYHLGAHKLEQTGTWTQRVQVSCAVDVTTALDIPPETNWEKPRKPAKSE